MCAYVYVHIISVGLPLVNPLSLTKALQILDVDVKVKVVQLSVVTLT